ncbi:MAG: NADH-quinone oxidoreductase subunit L [Rickettsiales bacterium]|nr:NADH-quinone oxidoreductase subunit L [Rickettsiales bacterium]
MNELAQLVVFLPLIAAVVVGFTWNRIAHNTSQIFTSTCVAGAALFAWILFIKLSMGAETFTLDIGSWITSGSFDVRWALRVDMLSSAMMLLVTSVSALVHVYSIGYMSEEPCKPRFMAYLSLFTFFMLMLVTADNLVQLFLGWEGVGLCSYLLIGFWYHKESANAAAMKAFIVNRVGDFGFALGIFAIYMMFDTVRFDEIFALASSQADATIMFLGSEYHAMTVICILLFIGAMGKSAQLGLHTWLPDAMEGPTPVSALIHAATMVTAGIFLVARMSPLFELSPVALQLVTYVGAATAIFAATVGLVQNDIKRVIAYSTCSQLGYMFFACGVSAYAAGMFHLLTHGFFKALLFLGAGSVIHALHHEQDMRKMGGLAKKVPITCALMWIGSLALAGIPPFSGYYSKDMIIEAAYAAHSTHGAFAFYMGVAAAFLTAFYSWRLLFMTFHGQPRMEKKALKAAHESPKVMLVPLALLALGAVFAGAIGYHTLGMVDGDGAFWRGAIFVAEENNVLHHIHDIPKWVPMVPLIVALSGIFLAWVFYIKCPKLPAAFAKRFQPIYTFLLNKWYFDELYRAIFIRGAIAMGRHFSKFWDTKVIDGLGPNGFAAVSHYFAVKVGKTQTGYLYHYAFMMLAGLVLLVTWYLVRGGAS